MSIKSARRIRHHGPLGERVTLQTDAAHKIADVLRLKQGEPVIIVDDEGREHTGTITALSPHHLEVALTGEARPAFELIPITLGIPFIKGDRMDWAIEKAGETGVARILPYRADRSVPRECSPEKLKRWRRIAEAAALQSGTGAGSQVLDPVMSLDAVPERFERCAHLDITGESVSSFLRQASPEIILAGPEGGWTPREHELLRARSRAVALGAQTYRAETAVLLAGFLANLQV